MTTSAVKDKKKDEKKEVKVYTKEEIDQLPLDQLEKFAKNLTWRNSSGGYDYRANLRQYKSRGYPRSFANAIIPNRTDFLRRRLKATKQEVWNPGAKAIFEEQEKKKMAAEAKKPKVKITPKVDIKIELKDARPNGHTFYIERSNGKLVAHQKQDGKAGRKGTNVCATSGRWVAEDFEHAVMLATSVQIPDELKAVKGAAKFDAGVTLTGDVSLRFERDGDMILIWQHDRHNRTSKEQKWWFKIVDLLMVIEAMKRRYKIEVVKEGTKGNSDKETAKKA